MDNMVHIDRDDLKVLVDFVRSWQQSRRFTIHTMETQYYYYDPETTLNEAVDRADRIIS